MENGDLDRTVEPEKKLDARRVTQSKQKKYKIIRTTNKLKVSTQYSSTSKLKGYNKRRYSKAKFTKFVLNTFFGKKVMICMVI